jgi:transposase-like protein
MRNALEHVRAKQRPAVAAMLQTIFAQEAAKEAHAQWNSVADTLRDRAPKLAALMDGAREDVPGVRRLPERALAADRRHKSAGAAERRSKAPLRRRGHLSERPRRRPAGGRAHARTKPRMGGQPTLHEP